MNPDSGRARIVIAVTETCPIEALWRAAMQNMSDPAAELVALFVADDRWNRAASLPFTREFPRIGGDIVNFTRGRAEQLGREAAERVQRMVQQYAAETKLAFAFKVLSEADVNRITELVGEGQNVLIASSVLTREPVYANFQRLNWRIVLVESTEQSQDKP